MSETVSLREFLELKIQHERELREAHENVIDRRLEGMNELREQIVSERGSFVSREMFETKHDLMLGRMGEVETKISNMGTARATLTWLWGAAFGAAAFIVAVLHLLSSWHAGQH